MGADHNSTEQIRLQRRNRRNIAVFSALLAFVVLVFAVTIVKIKLLGAP